jgi:hypothetical protein
VTRFDETRLLGIISEGSTKLLDARGERVVADDGLPPHRTEELFFGDRLTCTRDQLLQHGSGLGGQPDLLRARPKAAGCDVEAVVAEAHVFLHYTLLATRVSRHSPGEIPAGRWACISSTSISSWMVSWTRHAPKS